MHKSTTRIWAAAAAALLISGSGTFAETFRMSSWLPQTFPMVADAIIPWTKDVAEVTEGRVRIVILPNSVGSPPQQYDVAATGQADIVYGNQSYTAGRFSNYGFVELPGGGDDAVATSVAYWRTYEKFLKANDELNEIKVLSVFTHGPGHIFTNDAMIESDQGNGTVKIRGGGVAATRVVEALGMTAVQAPITQAAEMIANGIVDGIALEASAVPLFKFDKYVNTRLSVEGGFYNVSFFFGMNPEAWNRISPEDQAAIEAISGEALARRVGEVWKRTGDEGYQVFEESGYNQVVIGGDLGGKLSGVFEGFENDWIETVSTNGIDGREVLDFYRAESARLAGE